MYPNRSHRITGHLLDPHFPGETYSEKEKNVWEKMSSTAMVLPRILKET
jgi:hypothetical protein